jgi:hypothetical protein
MTFNLRLTTDNAAFDDGQEAAETARILRSLADRLEQGESFEEGRSSCWLLRDGNGNAVGSAWLGQR